MRSALLPTLTMMLACTATQPISVEHVGKTRIVGEPGDPVALRRPATSNERYTSIHTGAYVVRKLDDWQRMWRGTADAPPFTDALDSSRDMLLVVTNHDESVTHLHVHHAIETGGRVTVWVRQTMRGSGCLKRIDDPLALDVVLVPRIEKPIRFYIEDEDAPSCGEGPKAEIGCRSATADRDREPLTSKLVAKAGGVVECEMSTRSGGKSEIVDQSLTLHDLPPGSTAKLAFDKNEPRRAKLALDTFGTYAVRAEATDDAGRRGRATALIEVEPQKTRDVLVQVAWTDVDAGDPNAPLSRVLLRVAQEGPKAQRCSAEVPIAGLCEATTRGGYTTMKIPFSPNVKRRLAMSLLYLDERPQVAPAPCVHVWFNGERTATACDHDHRHPDNRWDIGTLDTNTGKVAPPPAPAPPPK